MKTPVVDNLIKSSISPVLKAEGFAKKERTWNRHGEHLTHVVDVQETLYGDSRETRFTLNIGFCSPKVFSICWGRPSPALFKEHQCQLRKRIGELLSLSPEGAIDYWWTLGAGTDAAAVAEEVATVLKGRVLPYLASITSLESLRAGLAQQTSFRRHEALTHIYAAIVTAMLGDAREAEQELDRLRIAHRDWGERINQVMDNIRNTHKLSM